MTVRYITRRGKRIEVETIETNISPGQRPERFVLVPEHWLRKLSTMRLRTRWLAVVLLWKSFQHYDRVFSCANLENYGISPRQKREGLVELEQAGMILIHRARGKSPRIKIALGGKSKRPEHPGQNDHGTLVKMTTPYPFLFLFLLFFF